jgi:hypothetical protein
VRVRIFWVDADGVSEERFCEGVVTEDSGNPAEVVENSGVARVVFEEGCEQARCFRVVTVVKGSDGVGDSGRVWHGGMKFSGARFLVSRKQRRGCR